MMETTPVLASRWKRLGGALIDAIIALAVMIPFMVATGVYEQITQPHQEMSMGQQILFFLFGQIVFLAINGYLLAKQGQTVGKKIVGTRIVAFTDGQRLPLGKVYGLRYLPLSAFALVPVVGGLTGLADPLFIFRKDKRCLHDLIAGTQVVDA
jgi:uncharacterized RDD family membrane protein YckC